MASSVPIRAEDYGVNPASLDNAPAFANAITAARNAGCRRVTIPAGNYKIASTIYPSGVMLEGDGSGVGVVVIATQPQTMFAFTGVAPGGGLKDMALHVSDGVTVPAGILLMGDSVRQPDAVTLDNLYITSPGSGRYYYCIHANGTQRLSPLGIRRGYWRNISVFNAVGGGLVLRACCDFLLDAVNGYAGAAPTECMYLWITGTDQARSDGVRVRDSEVSYKLLVDHATVCVISGRWPHGVVRDEETTSGTVIENQ